MKIEPKTRGFICTTAHPTGCDENVRGMIQYVMKNKKEPNDRMPKKVLVIGSSTGYGLASRIAAAFGCGAATIGVAFEKPASGVRTASAGWYNTAAFDKYASAAGLISFHVMGDAYSEACKKEVFDLIRREFGQIDLLVYSLAAPRRTMPDGSTVSSVLKPVGAPYGGLTVDMRTGQLYEVSLEPAAPEEIEATVKVMGGGDWADWVRGLKGEGLLADSFTTVAYSYIGPALTHAIYTDGSIGQAKADLKRTADEMAKEHGIRSLVSVNKALVTQSSAAIPVVPLYISILFREMKKRGTHEGVIEQMHRMMDKLYGPITELDENGYLRMDDWEMEPELQKTIEDIWPMLTQENVADYADFDAYTKDFLGLFGFGADGVDYEADTDAGVNIEHLVSVV